MKPLKYTINFTTKQGYTAQPSKVVKCANVAAAKPIGLSLMNGDTYTISIIDEYEKRAWHYGYTGVFLGTNPFK